MKQRGIKISGSFKPVTDKTGKVTVQRDTAAELAKLDLCTRLKRKRSTRVKFQPAKKIG